MREHASSPATLIVVAHPDDETLGASHVLLGDEPWALVVATDGAPRDPRWWGQRPDGRSFASAEQLAVARGAELAAALGEAGSDRRVASLGFTDLELTDALLELTLALERTLAAWRPRRILTHDYAGGHPDHDACAWAVRAAVDRWARAGGVPPPIDELALYHADPDPRGAGAMVVGELLPHPDAGPVVTHTLSVAQQARRARMLAAYRSQARTLGPWLGQGPSAQVERVRRAPRYEFATPPHAGALLYERWGFPITGAGWRARAAQACAALAQVGPPESAHPPSRPGGRR